MKFSLNIQRAYLKYLIIFLCLVCASLISYFRLFDVFELSVFDLRYRLRPSQQQSPEIVIIEISNDTLEQLAHWPLPRDFHATLIDVLKKYQVKQIIFDILFSEPTKSDRPLKRSIEKAGNVYLPLVLEVDDPLEATGAVRNSSGFSADIQASIKEKANAIGHINVLVDRDGKVRRVPLMIRYKNIIFSNIAFRAAADYLNLDLDSIQFLGNKIIVDNRLIIPVSKEGDLFINFAGTWEEAFQHYSYYDILAAFKEERSGLEPRIDLNALKNKICFIGLTATGTSDLKPTPLEILYPFVGIQANIYNSLLTQRFITQADPSLNILVIFSLFLLAVAITKKLKPLKGFLTILGLILFYSIANILIFVFKGIWIDLFYPIVLIFFIFLIVSIIKFVSELRRREILEKELSIAKEIQESFLPKEIEGFKDLDISCRMLPAKYVAGDIYDIVQLDNNRIGIMIADVSGKGVPASLVMAKSISSFRLLVRLSSDTADLLKRLNTEIIKDLKSGLFITMDYLIYDFRDKSFSVSSAGHSPVLIFDESTGAVRRIEPKIGFPLGIMKQESFSIEKFYINDTEKIVLYTDGVSEAKNAKGQEFGDEGLVEVLGDCVGQDVNYYVGQIFHTLKQFSQGTKQHDDISVIILSKRR